eukprot:11964379-Alexandrium_andersonii.AAC.1
MRIPALRGESELPNRPSWVCVPVAPSKGPVPNPDLPTRFLRYARRHWKAMRDQWPGSHPR